MIKVHKSLRKALSILTFVGVIVSSTGMAFVPVTYAQDATMNPLGEVPSVDENPGDGDKDKKDNPTDNPSSGSDTEPKKDANKKANPLKVVNDFVSETLGALVNGDNTTNQGGNNKGKKENNGKNGKNKGTIEICKVLVDSEGNLKDIKGSLNSLSFTVELTWNGGTNDNNGNDKVEPNKKSGCKNVVVTFDGDTVDVYYKEINIPDGYRLVNYHDRFDGVMPVDSSDVDSIRNATGDDSDGHIVLQKNDTRRLWVLNEEEVQTEPTATLVATKITCNDESFLPNWGNGSGPPINDTTATDFLEEINADSEEPVCWLEKDWGFQWAQSEIPNPGDQNWQEDIEGWNFFIASTQVPESAFGEDNSIWVREVFNSDVDAYVPFSGVTTTEDFSAEFYCHTDRLHYDNYDRVTGLQSEGEYHCVAFNVLKDSQPPVDQTATIQMCKLDDGQNPLSGWELSLTSATPVGSVFVAPDGTAVSSDVLEAGDYLLKVSGTYTYRPTNMQADAAFSHRKSSDNLPGQGVDDLWHLSSSSINKHLGLQVNNDHAAGWGTTFNPSHKYSQTVTLASDGAISFLITDNDYADNSGALEVKIYRVYGGETGQNGCVTLHNVPFGQYGVGEVMQDGWQNVSGLVEVAVDSANHTFTVVNESDTPIEQCNLEEADFWASSVASSIQGTRNNGNPITDPNRIDADNALGPNNWASGGSTGFLALGFGGEIVVEFNRYVLNVAGHDLTIFEATNGNYPLERAEVFVSQDNNTWHSIGFADNAGSNDTDLDFGSTGLLWIKYVKLVDKTDSGLHNNAADGFDFDAIRAMGVDCDEPVGQEPEDEFSISGTKTEVINGDDAMGDGWTIELYRLVDTVEVDSEDSTAVSSSASLTDGTQYLLEVSGTYKFGNPNRRADAEYTSELGDWTDAANDTYEDDFLDLFVDGVARDWGEFDSSHTYYLPFTGTGSVVSFLIKDRTLAYGDNEGVLTVRIFEFEDTDETGDDGEYSFDGLEEGTYIVREVNQDGWTQTMPEIGHCEISLSVDNQEGKCDFVNRQDGEEEGVMGTLQLRKLVLGTNTNGTGNFEITVTCDNGMNTTAVLGANGYERYALPVGTSCTVSEVNPGGAAVTYAPSATVTINAGGDVITWIDVTNDFRGNSGDGGDGDDEPASTFRPSSRSGGRILGDRTPDLNSDGEIGEVLGAATSIYPGMPNAGNATPFASVIVVQSLLIAAALLFYNRKVFVTRTENN